MGYILKADHVKFRASVCYIFEYRYRNPQGHIWRPTSMALRPFKICIRSHFHGRGRCKPEDDNPLCHGLSQKVVLCAHPWIRRVQSLPGVPSPSEILRAVAAAVLPNVINSTMLAIGAKLTGTLCINPSDIASDQKVISGMLFGTRSTSSICMIHCSAKPWKLHRNHDSNQGSQEASVLIPS